MSRVDDESSRISAFECRTRALLKERIACTDPQLRTRAIRARARALKELEGQARRWTPAVWVPAAGAAVLAAVAILVQVGLPPRHDPVSAAPIAISAQDVALLLNADNLDLLEQMEFYEWLDREPDALGSGRS